MHEDVVQSVGADGMQKYHIHGTNSNLAIPLILANGARYRITFPRDAALVEDTRSLSLEWEHVERLANAVVTYPLTLHLKSEATFAQLRGFDRGEMTLQAELRRENVHLRPCHAKLISEQLGTDPTRLPSRLADWTGDHLHAFFSAYPPAHSYNQEALHTTGGILRELTTGSMLMEEPDLVEYLRCESVTLTEGEAQIAVRDLGRFAIREYDVTIEFRTSTPGTHTVPHVTLGT
jgi:hypothetical protein